MTVAWWGGREYGSNSTSLLRVETAQFSNGLNVDVRDRHQGCLPGWAPEQLDYEVVINCDGKNTGRAG